MPQLRCPRFAPMLCGAAAACADLLGVRPATGCCERPPSHARRCLTPTRSCVTARDLVNGRSVTIDAPRARGAYIHLLLDFHEGALGNGRDRKSFHPALPRLKALDAAGPCASAGPVPQIGSDPHTYGRYARAQTCRVRSGDSWRTPPDVGLTACFAVGLLSCLARDNGLKTDGFALSLDPIRIARGRRGNFAASGPITTVIG